VFGRINSLPPKSRPILIVAIHRAASLNLELLSCVDPNFGLSFVHLDSASDFDVFSFAAG
jgi:hypothetical protein